MSTGDAGGQPNAGQQTKPKACPPSRMELGRAWLAVLTTGGKCEEVHAAVKGMTKRGGAGRVGGEHLVHEQVNLAGGHLLQPTQVEGPLPHPGPLQQPRQVGGVGPLLQVGQAPQQAGCGIGGPPVEGHVGEVAREDGLLHVGPDLPDVEVAVDLRADALPPCAGAFRV